MRLLDIKRQKKWVLCQVQIDEIGEPVETQFDGFVQSINVTFAAGSQDVMNYYYNEPTFELDRTGRGEQWYDIKWTGEYLKCKPAKAAPDNKFTESGVNWDEVNKGKCRHGILVACIQSGKYDLNELLGKELKEQINKLAEFSMTGE